MKRCLVAILAVIALVFGSVSLAEQQETVETLIKQLNSDDRSLQEKAAKKLTDLKDQQSTKDLIVTLKTGNQTARRYALEVLRELQDPRSIDSLRDVLGDKDPIVAGTARSSIVKFGPKAKDSLREGLKSKEWAIRFACAQLLIPLGDRSGVDVFYEGVAMQGPGQTESIKALSMLNEKKALDPLLQVLVHIDRKTRKKGQDIMRGWIGKYPDIIPDILNKLRSTTNNELKIEIISALSASDDSAVIQELVKLVKDPDVKVRLAVVQALSLLKNKQSIPVLQGALNDPDREVRKYAAVALSRMKVKAAIKPLVAFLMEAEQTDPLTINALANFGKEISPDVAPLLKHGDKHIRRSAAQVLGVINASNAADRLVQALKDPAPEVRAASAQALGRIKDPKSIPQLISTTGDADPVVKEEATNALVAMGSKTVSYLTSLWQSGDEKDRLRALDILSAIGDKKALSIFQEALHDQDAAVRVKTAQSLAKLGPKGVELLLDALKDTDINVQRAAIRSLGEIKDPRTIKPLITMLKSGVREEVIQVLMMSGSGEVVPALLPLLKDRDSMVRALSAEALGEIGDKRATEKLIALLSDREVNVRMAAAGALGRIGDPAAASRLLQLLSSEDIRSRRVAAMALGNTGGADVIPALLKAITTDDDILRRNALEAIGFINQRTKKPVEATADEVQLLIHLLASNDEGIRIGAKNVLVLIGSKSVDPLIEKARSGEKEIRILAMSALAIIGDTRASSVILENLNEEDPEIQRSAIISLGRLKEVKAVSPLVQKLTSQNWRIRAAAASALGMIKDERAVSALVRLLNDKEEKVRKAAQEALEKITGEKCPVLSVLTAYSWIDKVLFVLVLIAIVIPVTRKWVKPFDRMMNKIQGAYSFMRKERVQWWLAVLFGIIALAYFIYCTVIRISNPSLEETSSIFLTNVSMFTLKVFPFFVGGCLISGMAMKFFSTRNILPKSMIGTTTLGALLPLCSCGVVPLTRAMLTLDVPKRAVIAFLIVAPVLNPFVIFFSYGVIGLEYTLLRIVSVFLLAFLGGIIIEKVVSSEEMDSGSPVCRLCKSCVAPSATDAASSGLVAGWRLMLYLGPYIAIGILLGALMATYMPAIMVSKYLGSDFLGLFLASTIGVPLFICSGEDVVLLKPLLDMGLPMGHAIAFTIAGNAICLSSIALLAGVLGKKTTGLLTLVFWAGSMAIGYIINLFV